MRFNDIFGKRTPPKNSDSASSTSVFQNNSASMPEWQKILVEYADQFDGPIPDELLKEAFHLYCGNVRSRLTTLLDTIIRCDQLLSDGMTTLKAVAPDLVRRALDR